MANVSFLPAAEADYREALHWYEVRSAQAAAGFEAAMQIAVQRVAHAPESWPLCDNRHRFYILKRYPYSLIYRIEPETVLIVAVAHARRSPSFWKRR
jgi:plasmid stabilization system protein ParE